MDKQELINGYFEGSLTQNTLKEVNRLLDTDTEFKNDLEFQKELKIALKKDERQSIKALFSGLSETQSKKETKVIKMRFWSAAASMLLLLGLSAYFFLFNSAPINTADLYASNFVPYHNVIQPIERSNQLEDIKTKAFSAYENKEYAVALQLFEELNVKQNDSYIDFYKAMILMQLNKQEEAIPLLKNYISKEGELVDRAIWYLALAYLKIDEIEHSKAQLQALKNKNGFKHKATENLLEQLN